MPKSERLDVKFMGAAKVARDSMTALVDECVHVSFAVAWATPEHDVFKALVSNRKKIRRGVIGTHMYFTDPDALAPFTSEAAVRMHPPTGELFHPKLYLFEMPERSVVVIGSHNLTSAAYTRKHEASIALTVARGSAMESEVLAWVRDAWKLADPITPDRVYAYAVKRVTALTAMAQLDEAPPKLTPPSGTDGELMRMTWAHYLRKLLAAKKHGVDKRMPILDEAAAIALIIATTGQVELRKMRRFAGTVGPKEEDKEWGYFGRLTGFGVFQNLVLTNRRALIAALLKVPRAGEVRRDHYVAFVKALRAAFKGRSRGPAVPTASRLLALWRPDIFVPFNSANQSGVAAGLGVKPGSVNLDTYWEQIVIPTMASAWWHAPRPTDVEEGSVWDNRAALVDTLYYKA